MREYVDPKYIDMEYKNSHAYTTVMSLSKEQLEYRKSYTIGAIEYHTTHNNIGQIKFFTDDLVLINERLKALK
jgi:hypothetical protein